MPFTEGSWPARSRWQKVTEGFSFLDHYLAGHQMNVTALCAVELRCPQPRTEDSFCQLNETYRGLLAARGLFIDDMNPIARTNVCPLDMPPDEPSLHAFTVALQSDSASAGTFVISGSAEAPEGKGPYREHTVAKGELTGAGMALKARWVLNEMQRRLRAIGQRWPDCLNNGPAWSGPISIEPFMKGTRRRISRAASKSARRGWGSGSQHVRRSAGNRRHG
jgi:hypothetical protein